jgi:hypothetical protein
MGGSGTARRGRRSAVAMLSTTSSACASRSPDAHPPMAAGSSAAAAVTAPVRRLRRAMVAGVGLPRMHPQRWRRSRVRRSRPRCAAVAVTPRRPGSCAVPAPARDPHGRAAASRRVQARTSRSPPRGSRRWPRQRRSIRPRAVVAAHPRTAGSHRPGPRRRSGLRSTRHRGSWRGNRGPGAAAAVAAASRSAWARSPASVAPGRRRPPAAAEATAPWSRHPPRSAHRTRRPTGQAPAGSATEQRRERNAAVESEAVVGCRPLACCRPDLS